MILKQIFHQVSIDSYLNNMSFYTRNGFVIEICTKLTKTFQICVENANAFNAIKCFVHARLWY
jgi:hypothetical protein